MKATELRVGNWVNDSRKIAGVDNIGTFKISVISQFSGEWWVRLVEENPIPVG